MNAIFKRRVKNFIKSSIPGQYALAFKHRGEYRRIIPRIGSKIDQYSLMFENAKNGSLCSDEFFYYNIDTGFRIQPKDTVLSNMPVDYTKVVNFGIRDLIKPNPDRNSVIDQNNSLLEMMRDYISHMIGRFEKDGSGYALKHRNQFQTMLNNPSQSLEDACQRILIWNQFIWQSGHNLMGLGRVDKLLEEAYKRGKKNRKDAEQVIREFVLTLHKFYDFKSAALRGDTGQVLELGGIEKDGSYFYNDLTIIFLNTLKELHLPDPKIILRISKVTPDEVWEPAIQTICSGIGNPLLSNDDVIVPLMCKYYNSDEVGYNYATTACWSPVALGNSIGQCNPIMIQMIEPLNRVLKSAEIDKISTFENLKDTYITKFDEYITTYVAEINEVSWEDDPLLTLFTDGCEKNQRDISDGGAIYDDYGMQSIGFSNLINSLLNIKRLVFEDKRLTLSDVRDVVLSNYEKTPEYVVLTSNTDLRFGSDDEETLSLTNEMLERIERVISPKRNKYGKGYKFGISSASFITDGAKTGATFDGRKKGQPLGVQISSDKGVALTEVAMFASKLNYSAMFSNGNVMDIMLNRSMIESSYEAIKQYLRTCIEIGVFQIQTNILSLSELLDAKEHPENHNDLIVRVWGFNSYFNDLPDEYKDLMIERARIAEHYA